MQRVRHLLEEPEVIACLDLLGKYLSGQLDVQAKRLKVDSARCVPCYGDAHDCAIDGQMTAPGLTFSTFTPSIVRV